MKKANINKLETFDIVIDDVAPDKSISHRCAIFSLLSDKPSVIENYLQAEDTLNTLKIVKLLGANVENLDDKLVITPPKKLKEPPFILDCGNSGTAMRLFMGFLSTIDGFFVLHGDKYLANRPMKRVASPLRKIGAIVDGRLDGNLSPIAIRGSNLSGFRYESKIASAQVKSAMILAALKANENSFYKEPYLSRDHSERMLIGMGADISFEDEFIKISPLTKPLNPLNIRVPADPSSAFFFAVAAAILPNARVVLKNVSLNPTRVEAFLVLKKMGADVEFIQKANIYEPMGDIVVKSSFLRGVEVSENIAHLIDELPALSIAFACAKGKSIVKNAKELRVKESDRITSVVENLKLCGIDVKEFEDGYSVVGGQLKKATVNSYGDHRVAMSFMIAGLKSSMIVEDVECINTSFPNFMEILERIKRYGD